MMYHVPPIHIITDEQAQLNEKLNFLKSQYMNALFCLIRILLKETEFGYGCLLKFRNSMNILKIFIAYSFETTRLVYFLLNKQKDGKWKIKQVLQCLVTNKVEDQLISGSQDKTLKIWYQENNSWKLKQSIDCQSSKKIGGGQFDKNGEKIGLWLDINKEFFRFNAQTICVGEFEQGRRIGEWKILYKEDLQSNFLTNVLSN